MKLISALDAVVPTARVEILMVIHAPQLQLHSSLLNGLALY